MDKEKFMGAESVLSITTVKVSLKTLQDIRYSQPQTGDMGILIGSDLFRKFSIWIVVTNKMISLTSPCQT